MPSAFMALALLSIERVSEGVSWAARSEISMVVSLFKMERKLLVAIEVFNQRFEIILINLDDRRFALRVLDRIRCMRGIDHNRLAELSANGSRWGFGRISRAKHVANLAHRIHALIHDRNRFFSSRSIALVRGTLARLSASHKFDNAFPVFAAALWAEFFLKDWQHGPVELLRLGDAHSMDLEADDGEPRARKYFNDSAGAQIWKPKIVGFDQDKCLFDVRVAWKADAPIQDTAVRIRKRRPELQIAFDRVWIESREHARLEVSYFARIICDVIAVCVANRFAAGPLVQNVAYRAPNPFHSVGEIGRASCRERV